MSTSMETLASGREDIALPLSRGARPHLESKYARSVAGVYSYLGESGGLGGPLFLAGDGTGAGSVIDLVWSIPQDGRYTLTLISEARGAAATHFDVAHYARTWSNAGHSAVAWNIYAGDALVMTSQILNSPMYPVTAGVGHVLLNNVLLRRGSMLEIKLVSDAASTQSIRMYVMSQTWAVTPL